MKKEMTSKLRRRRPPYGAWNVLKKARGTPNAPGSAPEPGLGGISKPSLILRIILNLRQRRRMIDDNEYIKLSSHYDSICGL